MKKLISLVTIMVFALAILTGCMTMDYEVEINEDGSGTVSYTYGFDKEIVTDESLAEMEMTFDDLLGDTMAEAESLGYRVTEYEDSSIRGFKASKDFDDLTEFTLEDAFGVVVEGDNEIQFTRSGISQKASLDFTELSEMGEGLVLKYTVVLPVKATEHNADSVASNGKKLTWNFVAGEINEVEFVTGETGTSTEKPDNSKKTENDDEEKSDKKSSKDNTSDEWIDTLFDGWFVDTFGDNAMIAFGLIAGVSGLVVIVIIVLIAKSAKKGKSKPVSVNVSQPVTPTETPETETKKDDDEPQTKTIE